MILFVVDVLLLSVAMLLSFLLRDFFLPKAENFVHYWTILPFLILLFPMAFYFRGLYPSFGVDVIDELRDLTYSITIVYAIIATATLLFQGVWEYSRLVFLLSWALSVIIIPIGRAGIRKVFGGKPWWGIPVIIIGAGEAGERVIKSLQKHMHIGLRPILAVDDDPDRWGYIEKVSVIGGLNVIPEISKKLSIDHAIIAMPGVNRDNQKKIIQKYSKYFNHTFVIPDLFGLSSLWVSTRNLGGFLGLEVQQRLLKKASLIKKRAFDIILAITIGLLVTPFMLIISALIYIDSRGRIFFRQERMGIDDQRFEIIKFRTMHLDAEERLTHLLNQNPELKAEYEIYHKLKNDPRLKSRKNFA
jgi:FlaA1/EpsC-like NDP-sugar epimerase